MGAYKKAPMLEGHRAALAPVAMHRQVRSQMDRCSDAFTADACFFSIALTLQSTGVAITRGKCRAGCEEGLIGLLSPAWWSFYMEPCLRSMLD